MANPTIQYHQGAPIVTQVWDSIYAVLGTTAPQSASETRLVYVDEFGRSVVFSGSFTLDAGVVVGGTVTDFDAYHGSTKLLSGHGYNVSAEDLVDAVAAASTDDGDAFWDLLWNRPLDQIGSGKDDEMWGNGSSGSISAKAGNDLIWGSTGNEVLKGGSGNDLLYGSFGLDRLFGGKGDDAFIISDLLDDDRIMDFVVKDDMVGLSFDLFEELGLGFVGKSEFRIGSEAKTDDQHLIYNDKTGALYYDADGSDVAAKVQIAELDKHLDLQARNFFVTSDYEIK
jgi:Ca2+-binding RTX toxin-like protein